MSAASGARDRRPCVVVLSNSNPDIEGAMEARGWRVWRAEGVSALCEGDGRVTPKAVLVDWRAESLRGVPRILKADTRWAGVPVVLLLESRGEAAGIDWAAIPADDFTDLSEGCAELALRVSLAAERTGRLTARNPLTLLPGADAIRAHVEGLMAEERPFAYGAVDFANFKPFNDRYGFAAGDDVLQHFAGMLRSVVELRGGPEAMAAHASADDFSFVCDSDAVQEIGEELVAFFDQSAPTFYAPEDCEARHITVRSRAGQTLIHPLMTVSVACVADRGGDFRHFAEITQAAAEICGHLKQENRSRFLVNRRNAPRWSGADEVPEFEAA